MDGRRNDKETIAFLETCLRNQRTISDGVIRDQKMVIDDTWNEKKAVENYNKALEAAITDVLAKSSAYEDSKADFYARRRAADADMKLADAARDAAWDALFDAKQRLSAIKGTP